MNMVPSKKAVRRTVEDHPATTAVTALLAAGAAVKLLRNVIARRSVDRKRAEKRRSCRDALSQLKRKIQQGEVQVVSWNFRSLDNLFRAALVCF